MKIGEVSKMLNINSSAIRFYERHGLLSSKYISRAENGYRIYSHRDVEELRLIIRFKKFGLELKDIKYLFSEDARSCGDLVSRLDAQLEKYRQMEREIRERISSLVAAKNSCESTCKPTGEARTCCASSS